METKTKTDWKEYLSSILDNSVMSHCCIYDHYLEDADITQNLGEESYIVKIGAMSHCGEAINADAVVTIPGNTYMEDKDLRGFMVEEISRIIHRIDNELDISHSRC